MFLQSTRQGWSLTFICILLLLSSRCGISLLSANLKITSTNSRVSSSIPNVNRQATTNHNNRINNSIIHSNRKSVNENNSLVRSRKEFLQQQSTCIVPVLSFLLVSIGTTSLPTILNAVCLQGDTSEECIGVYKVPIDDEIIEYINTPEKMALYAPDIKKWIEPIHIPTNTKIAYNELVQLQQRIGTLKEITMNGNIIFVGKELLDIIPKVTVNGRFLVQTMETFTNNNDSNNNNNILVSKSLYRASICYNELITSLNECDILIGQGIRNELGSLTMVQILVLQNLDEIISFYASFISSIPKEFIVSLR